jgi:hypothetical protein
MGLSFHGTIAGVKVVHMNATSMIRTIHTAQVGKIESI